MSRSRLATVATVVLLGVAACGSSSKNVSASAGSSLVGLFQIGAGACASGGVNGSYFKMVQPGGTVDAGPYVSNPDSSCADQSITPLSPGADGGLRTGAYQPQPDPPFAANGGSASAAVIKPVGFFAVGFGISTNAKDPQTGNTVPIPRVDRSATKLTGDLSALSVSWNQQQFNQGSPKPNGKGTPDLHGTYDEGTGAYTLDWTSLIEGGPFNGFTGVWHLAGTFRPA